MRRSLRGMASMKWKFINAAQFILIFPFVIRFRLAAYMLEEAVVVVFLIAAGTMTGLFAVLLFALLLETIRAWFRSLAFRSSWIGGSAARLRVHTIAVRTLSAPDQPSNRVVGSHDSRTREFRVTLL